MYYNTNFMKCKDPNVRMPTYYTDHVNLRPAPHQNVANHSDSCLIDYESQLRNDKTKQTQDHCNIYNYFIECFKLALIYVLVLEILTKN